MERSSKIYSAKSRSRLSEENAQRYPEKEVSEGGMEQEVSDVRSAGHRPVPARTRP